MAEVEINESKKTKEYDVESKICVQIKNIIWGVPLNFYGEQGYLHCQICVKDEIIKDNKDIVVKYYINNVEVPDTMKGTDKNGNNVNFKNYIKEIGAKIQDNNKFKIVVEGFEHNGEYIEGSTEIKMFNLKYSMDLVIDFNIYDTEGNVLEKFKEGNIINIKGTVKYKDPYTGELKPLFNKELGFSTNVYVNSESIPNAKKVWTNILTKDGFETGNFEVKKEFGFTFDGDLDKITCQFEKTKTNLWEE